METKLPVSLVLQKLNDISCHSTSFFAWILTDTLRYCMRPLDRPLYAMECRFCFSRTHKARVTQDWNTANPYNHITANMWLPNTSDLSPINCHILGIEEETNQCPHNTTDALKAAITRVMFNINTENVMCAYKRLHLWIETIIAA